MPPISTLVLGLQGFFGVVNGFASLLSSTVANANAKTLSISSMPAIDAISLGSITIGAFYILAARNKDKTAMWFTVTGRAVAVFVFWRHGGPWRNVAIFEGLCGVVTAVSLGWEVVRIGEANGAGKIH